MASGRTAAGDSVSVQVTWSATGGTITSAGLYTAGQTAGSYHVIATLANDSLSDTASVTIATAGGGVPRAGHVFIVTEENHDYTSVIGSSAMPYLNSLAQQYGLAMQYYANTHPSIGNYFMLATGQIITNNDSYSTIVTVDNIVRRLLAAGKTWKSYAEDTGGDVGGYARKHNVFALLSDVANDSVQRRRLVPFTQFATDLANGTLPHFSNIVPNLCNDAHDCSLTTADTWLTNNIAPLIASPTFQQDGLLIIVFDESAGDNTNGGGRIAWVVVGPKAKLGYQSTTLYQHPSTLRLMLEALGITQFPGAAATAPAMAEFFTP
jgi:acid phosphatase